MKRIISLIVLLLSGMSVVVSAQGITAADAFVNAPMGLFPLLDRNTRLDMIDYFRSGSETASSNRLAGKSRVTQLAVDDISVELTEASSCQIALLPMGGDTIVALIKTVKTPIADSSIDFYTVKWQAIDKDLFDVPKLKDWLTKEGNKNKKTVESELPFILTGYKYDASTHKLMLTNNMSGFYQKEEYEKISRYLKPTLTYNWSGKKMKLEK